MRNMSFALTEPQLLDGSKTVTRRMGWEWLRPGVRVCAVRKCMGLAVGQKVERLGVIEVVSARREMLLDIEEADVRREGFPNMTPAAFVAMFCGHMGCLPSATVTRIEFKRVA